MKKRLTECITRQAATLATCLCFRVTSKLQPARVKRQLLIISSWQLLALSIFTTLYADCTAVGYSYTRFEGPVVGPERLVTVPDAYGGGTHSDYVARPEYSFAYGVEDGPSRVLQNRKETRHGDEVRGHYSVVDPDGTLRVVKYTADDANGFQAEVITNGVGTLHGHGHEGGGAAEEHHVEHEQPNEEEQQAHDDEADDDGEGEEQAQEGEEGEQEEEEQHVEATPQKAKGQYKVHEDYDEGEGGEGGEEGEGGENEGGGDHEEYEGSSEEGYEDAKTQRQQQEKEEQPESSEEY